MTTNHPVPTPPPSEPAPSLRPDEELQALCDAATGGPWFASFNVHGDPTVVTDPGRPSFSTVAQVSVGARDYGRANAEFIAAARTALPSLLARLRAADETLAAVGAWAMVNEIAEPPLDWAGLGAALSAPNDEEHR